MSFWGKSEEESPTVPTNICETRKIIYYLWHNLYRRNMKKKFSIVAIIISIFRLSRAYTLLYFSFSSFFRCCSLFITFDTHTHKNTHTHTHTQKMPQNYSEKTCRRHSDKKWRKISTQLFRRHFVFIVCRLIREKEKEREKMRVCILCGTLSGYLYLVGNIVQQWMGNLCMLFRYLLETSSPTMRHKLSKVVQHHFQRGMNPHRMKLSISQFCCLTLFYASFVCLRFSVLLTSFFLLFSFAIISY